MGNYTIDSNQVMHENIEGEVIVINTETGNYHSLRSVAADVWMMIDANYSEESILTSLAKLYPEQETAIQQDVPKFLSSLVAEDLLQVASTQSASTPLSISKQETGYSAPIIETYSDLQGLLLVDPIHDVADDGWPNVADQNG